MGVFILTWTHFEILKVNGDLGMNLNLVSLFEMIGWASLLDECLVVFMKEKPIEWKLDIHQRGPCLNICCTRVHFQSVHKYYFSFLFFHNLCDFFGSCLFIKINFLNFFFKNYPFL